MKMLLSFILLSLFSYWSIQAKPFFAIKYSDGFADAAFIGTAIWTNWTDIDTSESVIDFYLSMAMIKFNACSEPIGMQMQLQSTVPEMNMDFHISTNCWISSEHFCLI